VAPATPKTRQPRKKKVMRDLYAFSSQVYKLLSVGFFKFRVAHKLTAVLGFDPVFSIFEPIKIFSEKYRTIRYASKTKRLDFVIIVDCEFRRQLWRRRKRPFFPLFVATITPRHYGRQ